MHTVFLQLLTESMGTMGLIRKNKLSIYTLNEREILTDVRTGNPL